METQDIIDWSATKATKAQRNALYKLSRQIFPNLPRDMVKAIIQELNFNTARQAIDWGIQRRQVDALVMGLEI